MSTDTACTVASPPRRHRAGSLWHRALRHWLISYRRTWRGSVFSSFLAPVLYLGSLGYGLGALVDHGGGGRLDGVPYAAFVAPGVLAANAMQTAAGESTYPVFGAIKWQRQYHAMIAAPLDVLDVLLGHLAAIMLRVLSGALVFVAVGALLGAFGSWWVLLALPVTVLVGTAHAAPIMAVSVRADDDQIFSLINRFVIVPIFLFAGTFFPITQLPAVLRVVARLTPLWNGTQLCRDLALGRPAWGVDLGHAAYLLAWTIAGIWLARRAYHARLSQ